MKVFIYSRVATEEQHREREYRGFSTEEEYLEILFINWCRRLKGQAPLKLLEV